VKGKALREEERIKLSIEKKKKRDERGPKKS